MKDYLLLKVGKKGQWRRISNGSASHQNM